VKIDYEQLSYNKSIELHLRELENDVKITKIGNELDLVDSRFINDPMEKI
jgi:hypothetical protein